MSAPSLHRESTDSLVHVPALLITVSAAFACLLHVNENKVCRANVQCKIQCRVASKNPTIFAFL